MVLLKTGDKKQAADNINHDDIKRLYFNFVNYIFFYIKITTVTRQHAIFVLFTCFE